MNTMHSPRRTLWLREKNGHHVTADVVAIEGRWLLLVFAEGVLMTWHPCADHTAALVFANRLRYDLERDAWH